jgi:hypothetical protein
MSAMAFPDAKWLEFLKAGGLTFLGIALATGSFLYLEHTAYVPQVQDWAQDVLVGIFLLTVFLALTTLVGALWNFFEPDKQFVNWVNNRRRGQFVRQGIDHMTPEERHIIAYLLANNQRVFTAAQDGGRAATLFSSRIIEVAVARNQAVSINDVPFAIPEVVWRELVRQRDKFPYAPPADGSVQPEPWRETYW